MRKDNLIKTTELRHALHRIAELSMKEKETAQLLKEFLRRNTHFQVVDRGEWFYAVRKGTNCGEQASAERPGGEQAGEERPGRSRPGDELPGGALTGGRRIAFRADMDALPIAEDDALSYHSRNAGVSHKCGGKMRYIYVFFKRAFCFETFRNNHGGKKRNTYIILAGACSWKRMYKCQVS